MTSSNQSYKAFVSSTFIDLKDHRAHVIRSLGRAGFSVDPMENWTADSDEPKKFSQNRLDGCDLCVLLVAFRRGFVPDGETRSITQMEYDTAVRAGIDILPFVLAEDEAWPRKFDELHKDPGIQIWRDQLRNSHGVESFSLDPRSIDMTGALGRWFTKKTGQPKKPPESERIDWPKENALFPRLSCPEPVPPVPLDMVKVPKGPFLYGAERGREVIDYDYWIDKCQVTNEKYRAFILADGYENQQYWSPDGWMWRDEGGIVCPMYWDEVSDGQDNLPIVGVSYYEVEAFAKWVGKRLPTEKEWEKAARGTDGRKYPWGNNFSVNKCNCKEAGFDRTTSVSKFDNGVNPSGCYDMAGNVWEWCTAWYADHGEFRVVRGGSWINTSEFMLTSKRGGFSPDDRRDILGFRLVQDLP